MCDKSIYISEASHDFRHNKHTLWLQHSIGFFEKVGEVGAHQRQRKHSNVDRRRRVVDLSDVGLDDVGGAFADVVAEDVALVTCLFDV